MKDVLRAVRCPLYRLDFFLLDFDISVTWDMCLVPIQVCPRSFRVL